MSDSQTYLRSNVSCSLTKLEIWQFVEILYECGTHPTKNKNQGSFSETVIYLAVWDPY